MADSLDIDGRVTIPAHELSWTATRSSGPGGQNVNKVATKIDLRFELPTSEALSPAVKARLRALPGVRLDAEGRLVVTCQQSRSQADNLADARARLSALVLQALDPPKRRRPTRPSAGARRRRLAAKRQHAEKKGGRARVSLDD